ncbi:hypothetical protein FACS189483_06400 [Spirochaetia bacterium]|nr:hypothetical protein FACS189483_06400 [Spirochaetia bacterium]
MGIESNRPQKFITESTVWNRIAAKHQTLYVNQLFCQKKYLPKGLSSQQLFPDNPHGSELFYNEATIPQFCLKLQIKHSAEYIRYAKINNKKHIFTHAINKFVYPLGLLLYYKIVLKHFLKYNPATRNAYKTAKNIFKKHKLQPGGKIFSE